MNDAANDDQQRRANPFPENELPKWLLRQAASRMRRGLITAGGIDYKLLSRFSHDLGMCVRSSSDITRGLEICVKSIRSTRIGRHWSDAAERVQRGETLAESLRGAEDYLPAFYLPVIAAGEQSGRLAEALEFLESHCALLAGPASALRNLWLYPIVVMMAGSVIRVVLLLVMGAVGEAGWVFVQEFFGWLQLVILVALVMLTPARYFVDQVRLSVPWLGDLEREIALHRFFRVLALLYAVSGHRVEWMIETAAKTVSNHAARIDLLRAAKAIEQKATIPEAFGRVTILSASQRATIEVGEQSGKLESAFDQISDETGASMIFKLNLIQPILMKVVISFVIASIVITMLRFVPGL